MECGTNETSVQNGGAMELEFEVKGSEKEDKCRVWKVARYADKVDVGLMILGTFGAVLDGMSTPAIVVVLSGLVNTLGEGRETSRVFMEHLNQYTLYYVYTGLAVWMAAFLEGFCWTRTGERQAFCMRTRFLKAVLRQDVGFFDNGGASMSQVISTISNDTHVIQDALSEKVKSLVADRISLIIHTSTAVILATALGLAIAWRLAIVIIAVQPLTTLCYYTRIVLLKSMSKKSGDAQKQCSQIAAEAVANHRTVTAFCSSERVLSLFRATLIRTCKEAIKQSWLAGIGIGSAQSLTFLTWGFDYWYGGKLVHMGQISPGDVFKTYVILVSTGRVIAEAGSMTSDLAKGSAAFKSVCEILDRVTKINPDDPQGEKPPTIQGNIEFKSIDFAYPSRPHAIILKDFNLKISAGSSIALVGPSGSGKSTIIGLAERFYDPLKGTITVDGMDIKSLNLRCLRKHIALVGQEPVLFAGSIKDNILYGRPSATEAEIIQAATAANAHHFISTLKDGYETNCGDRNATVWRAETAHSNSKGHNKESTYITAGRGDECIGWGEREGGAGGLRQSYGGPNNCAGCLSLQHHLGCPVYRSSPHRGDCRARFSSRLDEQERSFFQSPSNSAKPIKSKQPKSIL